MFVSVNIGEVVETRTEQFMKFLIDIFSSFYIPSIKAQTMAGWNAVGNIVCDCGRVSHRMSDF